MKREIKKHLDRKRVAIGAVAIAATIGLIPNSAQALEAPLALGTASTYGVLASSTITSASASTLSGTAGGDIGVAGGTAPTGTITYSGAQVLAGASVAALASATAALADVRTGTALPVEIGAGRIVTPGAYTGGTFEITGSMTIDAQGDPNAVFIFRSASTLVTAVASTVTLINGAQACNVYWQVGSSATLGVSSSIVGHVIAQASISTGAFTNITGQLIASSGAVTLGGSTIVNSACAVTTPVVTPVVVPVVAPVVVAAAVVATGTLHVVKTVVNTHTGKRVASDFIIHVTQYGNEMVGSPAIGVGTPGRTYQLPPGEYFLYEDSTYGYRGIWSGDVSRGGGITIRSGETITATRTNYDTLTEAVVPTVAPSATPSANATATPAASATPTPTETTVDGAELPNTATPWGNGLLLGTILVALGLVGFSSRRLLNR